MEAAAMREHRMTWAAVERIAEGLGERDTAIVESVARVRVLTGSQLSRLHFADLAPAHRDRTRRRVLARLVSLRVLATLDRRIGGVRAGSAGLVFALGTAGQRLLVLLEAGDPDVAGRLRHPGTPTVRFLRHSLAVSELYVRLVEQAQGGALGLVAFRAEPAAWWLDGSGTWVKPDAYLVVARADLEDAWAVEADQATESLPTLRRKLMGYLELVDRGASGPDGRGLPRVLVTVPDEPRAAALRELIVTLPDPAQQLFAVTLHERAVPFITEVLRE
jgi:Replication-relaxation